MNNQNSPFADIPLPNGLQIHIADNTYHYYGDFHLVKLRMSVLVEPVRDLFRTEEEYSAVLAAFPEGASYQSDMERMAVPTAELARVKEELLENIRSTAVPYLASAEFPRKFLLMELARQTRRKNVVREGPWLRK